MQPKTRSNPDISGDDEVEIDIDSAVDSETNDSDDSSSLSAEFGEPNEIESQSHQSENDYESGESEEGSESSEEHENRKGGVTRKTKATSSVGELRNPKGNLLRPGGKPFDSKKRKLVSSTKKDGPSANSLSILTNRFLNIMRNAPETTLSLADASAELAVSSRRIYDVINVLEGCGMIVRDTRDSKSFVKWIAHFPLQEVPSAPSKLTPNGSQHTKIATSRFERNRITELQNMSDWLDYVISREETRLMKVVCGVGVPCKDLIDLPNMRDRDILVLETGRREVICSLHAPTRDRLVNGELRQISFNTSGDIDLSLSIVRRDGLQEFPKPVVKRQRTLAVVHPQQLYLPTERGKPSTITRKAEANARKLESSFSAGGGKLLNSLASQN